MEMVGKLGDVPSTARFEWTVRRVMGSLMGSLAASSNDSVKAFGKIYKLPLELFSIYIF